MLFFGAAVETPAMFLTNAVFLLAQHDEERRRLTTGAVPIDAAIEELLRYESPVQCLARTLTVDTTIRATPLPKDTTVLLVYGAANRDDSRWSDPDRLDLGRPHKRHLAFGEGIHFCLGAPLTRLLARVAIPQLLAVSPDYAITAPPRRILKYSDWGVLSVTASV